MKLYDILFEAAKTPQEAVGQGLGLVVYQAWGDAHINLILFSLARMRRAAEELAQTKLQEKGKVGQVAFIIRKRSPFIARITATKHSKDLYAVSTSAAVDKFGPSAYEMVMAAIYPAYLKSDTSLTDESIEVWSKFNKRSDVQRKWLGTWGNDMLFSALDAIDASDNYGGAADENSILNSIPIDERGPLYAYRKATAKGNIGSYDRLLARGHEMIAELAGAANIPSEKAEQALVDASGEFFATMYYSGS